jgi:hypothetical protein
MRMYPPVIFCEESKLGYVELDFAQREWNGIGMEGRTWWMLVAGAGPDEDLSRMAPIAQSSPRRRHHPERKAADVNGRKERRIR